MSKIKELNANMINILKRGEIKTKTEAEIFAQNAEFEEFNKEWGDFRIKIDNVCFAEIYGTYNSDEEAIPDFPQKIRFYEIADGNYYGNDIKNPFSNLN